LAAHPPKKCAVDVCSESPILPIDANPVVADVV